MNGLRDALCQLVRQVAADEVMPRFLRVGHEVKSDGTLLTEADLAVQRALVRLLPQLADYPVLGEEMSAVVQQDLWAANLGGLWVVDPVDGTTNFARGMPFFGVSVALVRHGKPVLGVVHAPALNECFAAELGGGAWLNGASLSKLPFVPMREAVAAVEPKRLSPEMARYTVSSPPYHGMRNFGAGTLDWCWLAAGRIDLMLHGGQKLWDYAAGALIAQEAGCCIAKIESDDFWGGEPWVRSIVASRDPAQFAAWCEWVRLCR